MIVFMRSQVTLFWAKKAKASCLPLPACLKHAFFRSTSWGLVFLFSLCFSVFLVSHAQAKITFAGQAEKETPVSFSTEVFRLSSSNLNVNQPSGQNASSPHSAEVNHDSRDILLLLWLTPANGNYAYANDPGEGGLPTKITLLAPGKPSNEPKSGNLAGDMLSPAPRGEIIYPLGKQVADIYSDGKQVNVYNERTPIYIYLPGILPASLLENNPHMPALPNAAANAPLSKTLGNKSQAENAPLDLTINFEVSLLLCSSKNCTPVKKTLSVDIFGQQAVRDLPLAEDQPWWNEFSEARSIIYNTPPNMAPVYDSPVLEIESLGKALALGFIAGLILNFMPCVFPVVSLKLLSFIITLGQPDSALRIRAFRRQNAMFALGVIVWFTLLSGILSAMDLLWGQIFQSQGMVMAMLLLVFALTLSLFGLFMLPSFAFREKQGKVSKRSAFITGMIATCLATPCSGPLLGGVLGWSFNQPQPILGIVFVSVGLGMASPYIMLAIFPKLGRHFPKPGPWLARLEVLLGFFLMLTCAYLFTLLTQDVRIWAVAAMLALFVLGWLWGKLQIKQGCGGIFYWRWLLGCLGALVLFLLLWQYVFYGQNRGAWEPYNKDRFMALQGEKNIVLEFTADWCPNCKLLERTVFTSQLMEDWQSRYDVVFMQVDLTSNNPEGYEFLNALGSNRIPVVALFPKHENAEGQLTPLVLRDLFGPEGLEEAAEKVWNTAKH